MESISISRLVVTLFCSLLCNLLVGQNSYFVFKKTGNPFLNDKKLLERGSLFTSSDTLYMAEKDSILLVGQAGELYEINSPNAYVFEDVGNYKKELDTDSFTQKYFTYVWKQFTNQYKKKQEAGVVYREERNIEILEPMDSVKMHSPEIRFSWKNKTDIEEVYFMLKELETGHLTKIGVTGNTVLLHMDNQLLRPGKKYSWAVATTSFPNLKELKFNRLDVLTIEEHDDLKHEIKTVMATLQVLGFSENEIRQAICMDYKFCM